MIESMKLVLCSEGFYTSNTVQACVELCGKPQEEISVAIINEAYAHEEGDKNWVLENLNDVTKNFKGKIDLVNLLALPLEAVEARISKRDVIFVIGGDADYLKYVFDKSGFSKLLPKLLESKVYVGSSAGSMVMGRRLSTKAFTRIYGKRGVWGIDDYLGIVDLAFVAHLNSVKTPNNRADILEEVATSEDFPVYGLEDDSAIVITDTEQSFIGSKPVKIINRKMLS